LPAVDESSPEIEGWDWSWCDEESQEEDEKVKAWGFTKVVDKEIHCCFCALFV
jgi:hypothetical protein